VAPDRYSPSGTAQAAEPDSGPAAFSLSKTDKNAGHRSSEVRRIVQADKTRSRFTDRVTNPRG
jgi:hypothetical protein